ncbi:MAG: VTT domain-containing protein [Oscillospiraceae bacterium]|nr:VTT domain-containing protein [Oscillospiraceae bacterium]
MKNIFQNKKAIKIAAVVILVIVMVGLTIAGIPLVKLLSTDEGREMLEAIVERNVVLGVIVYLLLQMLQVVVALIPGGVIQILGGVLFGNFWGPVLCFLGILLGTVLVFSAVRKFGMPLVEAFVDGKGIKRFAFLNDDKKLEATVFILFLIPGMPKDALTYIVPLTKIKPSRFFFLSMLARTPAIILSTVFGTSLSDGNLITAVILFAVVAVLGLVGILFKDKIIEKLRRNKESA